MDIEEDDLIPNEEDPIWDINSKELEKKKRKKVVKITTTDILKPQSISIQFRNEFILWLKSLDPKTNPNNQVSRLNFAGSFKEAYIRGMLDLWEEFVLKYDFLKEGFFNIKMEETK